MNQEQAQDTIDKCQNCKREEAQIEFWVMDSTKIHLVCQGCSKRFRNVVNVSNNNEIKYQIAIWVKKVMKKLIGISQRIFNYSKNWKENLINQEGFKFNCFKDFKEFYEFQPKIDQALTNLTNQLNNYKFPQSEIQFQSNPEDIKKCQKLIKNKEIFQAEEKIKALDTYNAKYFQIECLIIQKNIDEAQKQSLQIQKQVENQQIDKSTLCNLKLQNAKICHKKGLYIEALTILKRIKRDEIGENNNDRINLQIAKTFMKCGNFNVGFQRLEKESLKKDKNSQENIYECQNYPFSLTYAKAFQLQKEADQSSLDISQYSQQDIDHENSNLVDQNPSESPVRQESGKNQNQNNGEIKKIYLTILEDDPYDQKALYGLSQLYMKIAEFEKAQDVLYKLYQFNPSYKKAEIGILYCKQKLKVKDLQQDSLAYECEGFMGCLIGCLCKLC